jgi:RNA polymerase sigma factor for flagellar operon FliA
MTATATCAAPTRTTARQREELVRAHLPLVGHLVRETLSRLPAHVNRDDLTSAAMAALATAAAGFDPARGTPFAAFATTRVRGALLDELRGADWASRSVRARARRIDGATQALTASLGRTPTPAEVAEALGTSVEELRTSGDDVHRAMVLSLQGFTTAAAEDLAPDGAPGPEELLLHREQIGYLHEAVAALPDRLRHVVRAYFFDNQQMATIAADLGVTESRVSQLRAEALTLLRDGLNTQLDPERVAAPAKPAGCAARRRHAYYAAVAGGNTLRSRLSHTTALGVPVAA